MYKNWPKLSFELLKNPVELLEKPVELPQNPVELPQIPVELIENPVMFPHKEIPSSSRLSASL